MNPKYRRQSLSPQEQRMLICDSNQRSQLLEPERNVSIQADTDNWGILRRNHLLVDKSLLLLEIINKRSRYIIRPRKWGKSTNMCMLKDFYQCPLTQDGKTNHVMRYLKRAWYIGTKKNQELYLKELMDRLERQNNQKEIEYLKKQIKKQGTIQPLKISQFWEQYCQKSFANKIIFYFLLINKSKQKLLAASLQRQILNQIYGLYRQHPYLRRLHGYDQQLDSLINKTNFMPHTYLNILANFLSTFHSNMSINQHTQLPQYQQRQIITLVDEYDSYYSSAVITEAELSLQPRQSKAIIDILSGFLEGFTKAGCSLHIRQFIATGVRYVLYFQGMSSQNLTVQSMNCTMDRTHQFYGFTQKQIKEELVFKVFKHDSDNHKNALEYLMEIIKVLYNGYKINPQQWSKDQTKFLNIYNPYSVIKYIEFCMIRRRVWHMNMTKRSNELNFWTNTSPSQAILKVYLQKSSGKNQRNANFAFYLFHVLLQNKTFSQNQHRHRHKIQFSPTFERQLNRRLLDKALPQYQQQDFIYLLITIGYLTVFEEQVQIPNQELRIYFSTVMINYFNQQMNKLNTPLSQQFRKQFNIAEWNKYSKLLEMRINNFLKSFHNFCQPLFTALITVDILTINWQEPPNEPPYFALYEKKMFNIQPDLILIPNWDDLPLIIHEHKNLISAKCQKLAMTQKAEEAVFQILHKNYFLLILHHQSCLKLGWKQIIVRGVVAHYSQREKLTMFGEQMKFSRKFIEVFSRFSELSFTGMKQNVLNIRNIIKPRYAQSVSSTLQLMRQISQAFKQQVYQRNQKILQKAKDLLAKAHAQNKKNQRKRQPSHQQLISIEIFNQMTAFLEIRFFGSSKIQRRNKNSIVLQLSIFYQSLREQIFFEKQSFIKQAMGYIQSSICQLIENNEEVERQQMRQPSIPRPKKNLEARKLEKRQFLSRNALNNQSQGSFQSIQEAAVAERRATLRSFRNEQSDQQEISQRNESRYIITRARGKKKAERITFKGLEDRKDRN